MAKSAAALAFSPFFSVGFPTVVVRLRIFRVQSDGLGEVGDCLVGFVPAIVGHTTTAVQPGVFLFKRDSHTKVGNRLVKLDFIALLRGVLHTKFGNGPVK